MIKLTIGFLKTLIWTDIGLRQLIIRALTYSRKCNFYNGLQIQRIKSTIFDEEIIGGEKTRLDAKIIIFYIL